MNADEAPSISVVIATCGRVRLALEAVRSVLLDGLKSVEVIVVDQDPSRELEGLLSSEFPAEQRVRYTHLDRAVLSAARNAGVECSRGEIVVFLDDDAVLVPGCLQAYLDAFASRPRPGVVAGRVAPDWASPRPSWLPASKEYLLGIYDREGSLAPMPGPDLPVGANFAVLRSAVREIGPFDERLGFSYARAASMIGGEDSLFSLRAKAAGSPVLYQPAAVARHRIPATKLRPRAFLRRSYWEGMTTAILQHLTGCLSREDASLVARRHRRAISTEILRLFRWRHRRWRLLSPVAWMDALASCAQSLGMIRSCARLRRNGILP